MPCVVPVVSDETVLPVVVSSAVVDTSNVDMGELLVVLATVLLVISGVAVDVVNVVCGGCEHLPL